MVGTQIEPASTKLRRRNYELLRLRNLGVAQSSYRFRRETDVPCEQRTFDALSASKSHSDFQIFTGDDFSAICFCYQMETACQQLCVHDSVRRVVKRLNLRAV